MNSDIFWKNFRLFQEGIEKGARGTWHSTTLSGNRLSISFTTGRREALMEVYLESLIDMLDPRSIGMSFADERREALREDAKKVHAMSRSGNTP
jgi:hypothetical protein